MKLLKTITYEDRLISIYELDDGQYEYRFSVTARVPMRGTCNDIFSAIREAKLRVERTTPGRRAKV